MEAWTREESNVEGRVNSGVLVAEMEKEQADMGCERAFSPMASYNVLYLSNAIRIITTLQGDRDAI